MGCIEGGLQVAALAEMYYWSRRVVLAIILFFLGAIFSLLYTYFQHDEDANVKSFPPIVIVENMCMCPFC